MSAARSLFVAVALGIGGVAQADDALTPEDAVRTVTNPLPVRNKLQVQASYIRLHEGGYATEQLVRLGVVYHSFFLPGVELSDIYSLARLEMFSGTRNSDQVDAAGLLDWTGLVIAVKPFAWGLHVGAGIGAILPTATSPSLGTQEFQLGPALGVSITRVPHMEFSTLVQLRFSVAGPRPDLGYFEVQPVISYHFPGAFYLLTDPIFLFDFRQRPAVTVPVNLHFGYGISRYFAVQAIVQAIVAGDGLGDIQVKLSMAYVNW